MRITWDTGQSGRLRRPRNLFPKSIAPMWQPLHTAGDECPTCDGDPQPEAGATKPVRRDQRRAGAEKGVEHGIATLGEVQELARQHSDGFGRGRILQTPPGRRKSVGCLLYGAGDILRTHFGIDHFFVI
jgi:hypothetical protein